MQKLGALFSFSLFFCIANFAWSQIEWIQTDWSNNKYNSLLDVDTEISPGELILKNKTSNMVFAFSPTQLEGVWNMEVYNGKLFVSVCTDPGAVDGGEIISYDYATNTFQWEYDVWEQGVIQMRSYNGKLYVPGLDSQGSWEWGNIYIYDGNSWVRKETVPHGVHVCDLIFYQGEMYVTTGTDIDNYSGKVYKSSDEGDSWIEVFSVEAVPGDYRRFYMMGIYKDTLYVQSDLKAPEGKVLFYFDGSNWGEVPVGSLTRRSHGVLEEYKGKFYFLNRQSLYIYDGNDWVHVILPFSGGDIAKGLGFYNGLIYGGAENGFLYSSEDGILWQLEAELGNIHEEIESIEVYHGRLYVGTNDATGQGRVYVSAAAPYGSLVSLKYDFGCPIEAGIINWNALIPDEGTSIKFQLKTANSDNDLDNAAFVGPDGTTQSFYETAGEPLSSTHFGDRWIQYKVYLTTGDIALTPILQDVNISVSNTVHAQWEKTFIDTLAPGANFPAVGDIEDDGDIDILALSITSFDPLSGVMLWYEAPDWKKHIIANDLGMMRPVDFNGDSTTDIVAANNIAGEVVWYEAPIWTRHVIDSNLPEAAGVEVIDLDKDGDLDVVATATDPNKVVWYEAPNWIAHTIAETSPRDPFFIETVDIDLDNDIDIIIASEDGIFIFEAPTWTGHHITDPNRGSQFDTGDIDSDGDLDIVVGNPVASMVFWYENPTWTEHIIDTDQGNSRGVGLADLDKDDDLDVISVNESGVVAWHEYPTWVKHVIDDSLVGGSSLCTADIDGDGLTDIVACGSEEGHVVFYRSMMTTGVSSYDIATEIPRLLRLHQNYPNPFNPSTTIKYNLRQSNFVTLKLYNLAGQEIETLVNGFQTVGEHQIKWKVDGLPSGIYFYRMQAGEFSETKKLILQK